ncbi:MAG: hypothetical protein UY13_C0002G0446 [Candidatus Pacebacteria bacterium GW2011_GWB1_47_8]|nr:MAG: hypothetical protein UX28_C0002G0005 [Candidatus Pacebacteria bacterium GW2011_GWA1_46_10]KKU84534.1 MAG: hypothetical protein UY13_C0002G0446 [Candidatus Pacebacteria bacterium GW2011_GWB1_47_8]HCR81686.1 hypothetical protein [Candidatus Paceibacterota bacterium]
MLQSSEVHLEKVVLPSGTVKAGVRLENGLIVALSEKHLEEEAPELSEYELLSIAALRTDEGFNRVLESMEKELGMTLPIRTEPKSGEVNWYAWASVIATDTKTFVNLHYMQI